MRPKASICGSQWKETRELKEDGILFFLEKNLCSLMVTSIWGHEMLGFRMGQGRCSRERAGYYRIPLCQALFGACSMYSAPLLGVFTFTVLVRYLVWQVGSFATYFSEWVIARVRSLPSKQPNPSSFRDSFSRGTRFYVKGKGAHLHSLWQPFNLQGCQWFSHGIKINLTFFFCNSLFRTNNFFLSSSHITRHYSK